jgi:hypothetical protein
LVGTTTALLLGGWTQPGTWTAPSRVPHSCQRLRTIRMSASRLLLKRFGAHRQQVRAQRSTTAVCLDALDGCRAPGASQHMHHASESKMCYSPSPSSLQLPPAQTFLVHRPHTVCTATIGAVQAICSAFLARQANPALHGRGNCRAGRGAVRRGREGRAAGEERKAGAGRVGPVQAGWRGARGRGLLYFARLTIYLTSC